jgi:alkylation response protein AidB-like acyl-CoA dehydrogenase
MEQAMSIDSRENEAAFRLELRTFIETHYPPEMLVEDPPGDLTKEQLMLWHRALHTKGWSAPHWPKQYGGAAWSEQQRLIWEQETARVGTFPLLPFSVNMVGPVIYTFGTPEQKARFLPGILSGDDWWCQGYSEPGAGSDLARLRTRAERVGDGYLLNGHKTWTTWAHLADWIFVLARTDAGVTPQRGISFLLVDMKSPGVSVRPIISIDGTHEVNDVFFDNVKVPAENLIGDENKGWTYAKFLLGIERTSMSAIARQRKALNAIKAEIACDKALAAPQNGTFMRRLARVEIELLALEMTELRVLEAAAAGRPAGAEASLFKIKGTEINQEISELAVEAVGIFGLINRAYLEGDGHDGGPLPQRARMSTQTYLNVRKTTIFGGSNEIQRNIIAKAVLGL